GVTLVDVGSGPSAADDAVRSDRADVVVVLPAAFAPSQPGSAPIEVVTSGLSPGEDAARIGELQRIVASQLPAGGIQISRRTVYGGGSNDALDTFAPALLGFFGFFFVFILTGISFLRERVGGTFERLLATPVARGEIVLGYSIGFTLFAALQVTLILLFALSSLAFEIGSARVAIGLGIPTAGAPILAFLVVVLLAIG